MHDPSRFIFAYIDPGGGAFFIQILLGGILAWVYRFRRAISTFFRERDEAKAKTAKS